MTKISVIISTKNRAHAIIPCLDSIKLSFAHAGHTHGEIIIVDNGSTDNTQAVVTDWITRNAETSAVLRYESKSGVSAGRNCGIKSASGDIFIFTDDDCLLSKTYVSEALQYVANDKQPIMRSGSVVLGDPSDLPITVKQVTEVRYWQRPMTANDEGKLLGDALIGCNMMMPKAVIDKVGLFDEKLGGGTPCKAAEDTDYYYRGYLAGVRLEIVPNMVVSHFHGRKTEEEKIKLMTSYAIGNGALIAKYLFIYPNFSRHLYWDIKKYFKWNFLRRNKQAKGTFAHPQRLFCELKGMWYYWLACLKSD